MTATSKLLGGWLQLQATNSINRQSMQATVAALKSDQIFILKMNGNILDFGLLRATYFYLHENPCYATTIY